MNGHCGCWDSEMECCFCGRNDEGDCDHGDHWADECEGMF